ncbi:MAG TPA: DinB family protein [Acidimicrobiales bacterium]
MERCGPCGFEYDLDQAPGAGPAIVAGVATFVAVLGAASSDPARRPQPAVWSPLEYGCHTRDVLLVQRERVLAARRRDRASFEPMGRDERVEHDGYGGQDPTSVARQMTDAAAMFARVLARLDDSDWERRVIYTYPARTERSLRWVAVHTVHEVRHHLVDVRHQLTPS